MRRPSEYAMITSKLSEGRSSMWLLPSWDSLEQIQTFSGRMTWFFLFAGLVLAAAGVVQRVYDSRAVELQARIDEKQEIDRRALQDRVNKAEKTLAPRTDFLTPAVRKNLAEVAATLPEKSVKVSALSTTSEAVDFANEIGEILHVSGRLLTMEDIVAGGVPIGVQLYHSPGESEAAQKLAKCLADAGVPDVSVVAAQNKYHDGRAAYLHVAAKR